jgi:hypothetical protein
VTFNAGAFGPSSRKPVWLDPAAQPLLKEWVRDKCGHYEITINFPTYTPETLHQFRWSSIHNQLTEPEQLPKLRCLTIRIPCSINDIDTSRIRTTIENDLPHISALGLLLVEFISLI